MHRFTLLLATGAVGGSALICMNAASETDAAPPTERLEYRHEFAAVSGGHYFGEDEPPEVQRLSLNELKARLSYGSDDFHRAQAKGQVAQLRDRLDKAHALTSQQGQLMEEMLIEIRDRWERDLREQYAGHRITSAGGSWTGMITLASDELGISERDQESAQIEDFSRQQIAAVAPVLSPQQLTAYRQIQRERVAQQKKFLDDRPKIRSRTSESPAQEPPPRAARLGIVYDYNPIGQSKPLSSGAHVARVESGSVAERAGLLPGDDIVKFGDHDIHGADLQSILATKKPGDTVTMVVVRNGVETPLVAQF